MADIIHVRCPVCNRAATYAPCKGCAVETTDPTKPLRCPNCGTTRPIGTYLDYAIEEAL
jgi:hypothetical protein